MAHHHHHHDESAVEPHEHLHDAHDCHSCGHHHHDEHNHEHHHEHHHHEHGSLRGQLVLIIATAVLLAAAVLIEKKLNLPLWQMLLIYLVPYLLIGHRTLLEAVEGLAQATPLTSISSCR